MKSLDDMNKEELKQYAKENGIRLYTSVEEKMRKHIKDVKHVRETHGDAFRK